MYDALKAITVRLDSTSQSLTRDAIAQVIIKIIYKSDIYLSKAQIIDQYKQLVKCDDAIAGEIITTLDNLVLSNDIIVSRGQYHLSTNKRDQITALKQESDRRFNYIIDTYFHPTFSAKSIIHDWLQDALVTFFSQSSKEWIADLCYNQNAVLQSIDQVLTQIERRTINNKDISREDRNSLVDYFRKFLSIKDPEVDSLLWEYGTAQFSAQLIKNGSNIDKLTVGTFSGGVCLLDTNILLHLALTGTDYSKHLNSIEKIFHSLGITVRYLYITKTEYENTVTSKSKDILRIVESYPPEIVADTDNQLIQSAVHLGCKTVEDYLRFFKQIGTLPTVINNTVRVSLLDDDKELDDVITCAQKNEHKKAELNSAYKSFKHRDKPDHALIHDVGLIAGADFLRKSGKFFILSQDSSIINYAKQYPFQNGLPIAIKIETLLNVLSVNSFQSSCEDYIPLFASLIRQGLQPRTNTFKVADLSYILEKEQFVSTLPAEMVREIVTDISHRRLLGESDESISKELNRQSQTAKMQVTKDLECTRLLLSSTDSKRQLAEEENAKGKKALIAQWKSEKETSISDEIHSLWKKLIWVPIAIVALSVVIVLLTNYFDETVPLWGKISSAVLLDVAISYWTVLKDIPSKIRKLKKEKHHLVEDYINEKLNQTYG